jgi:2-C-methyl-D-erythritol 4-phosphate cytidylyltransferase
MQAIVQPQFLLIAHRFLYRWTARMFEVSRSCQNIWLSLSASQKAAPRMRLLRWNPPQCFA